MQTPNIKKLYFKDTSFVNLMQHRVYNVLLLGSKYDVFTIEEDGRIEEQLFNEYTSLNLRFPPRFTLVSSEEHANKLLKKREFDLIISMPSGDSINPFEWAKSVKRNYPKIPIVVLTPFSRAVSERISKEDLSAIDYVFSWLGNSELLLAIIKLVEDQMNVKEDVKSVGVQTILFVEDSIHFYSSLLPMLYKHVFVQSRSFMTEALNEHEQMLRMRGRPKILLARSYEEAMKLYKRYENNMLGVITDVSFNRRGVKDKQAGIRLCKEIRSTNRYIPLIVESTEEHNRAAAYEQEAVFLSKMSKTLIRDLQQAVTDNFGFGDFVFSNPHNGTVECVVKNLKELQTKVFDVSDDTLYYHVAHNHISRWLYSRALFPLAEFLKNIEVSQFKAENAMDQVRQCIFDAIVSYRRIKNRGVVAVFQKDRFDQYSNFARIGSGSMGGKGRGLAFIDAMIKRNYTLEDIENSKITIPRTVVLCTDVFTEFMEKNNLYPVGLSDLPDEEILARFLKASLPKKVLSDLFAFLDTVQSPIAVRSSSLLEDSHYQPFAGIYSTYMVPYVEGSRTHRLMLLKEAIKAVYASVYYRDSKAYMTATKNVIDEEKMAVVLQEVCGTQHGDRYYPSFSGVARSLNYYPIGDEKAEEGIANIAMGLGKYIVDGGQTLRFSPKHPNNVLQTSTIEMALKETQSYFNALDLKNTHFSPQTDDGFNLLKLSVKDAEKDGTLRYIASTYDFHTQTLYPNITEPGRRVITFANILEHKVFPLAEILEKLLEISQREMGRPIEIEFAVNLDYSKAHNHTFYLLQIRPIVDQKEMVDETIGDIPTDETILTSNSSLGHGIYNDIYDIVYVKPEHFDSSNNVKIAEEIGALNRWMTEANRPYVLVGPGRWGSSDHWLGIPVKWPQISNARIIVEAGQSDYRIDPSQGTHFFQNLTSFGVAYLTINPYRNDGSYNLEFLNSQAAEHETDFIRHIHFDRPIIGMIDGRSSKGVVLKPQEEERQER